MKKDNKKIIKPVKALVAGMLVIFAITSTAVAGNFASSDSFNSAQTTKTELVKEHRFKMTTLTFGGNGVQFTGVLDQFTVKAGGRGSATFNNRYTIGGGGWGMTKGVKIEGKNAGIYPFLKMGYGGVDLGYLLYPGEKLSL